MPLEGDGKMIRDEIADILEEHRMYQDFDKTPLFLADKIISLISKTDTVADVPCNDGLSGLAVTEEMLTAAMRKGVEVGIFPKHGVDTETYLKHWDGMRKVLETALAT